MHLCQNRRISMLNSTTMDVPFLGGARGVGWGNFWSTEIFYSPLWLCIVLFGKTFHSNLWNFLWKRHVGGDQHGHQYGGRQVKETSVIKFFITLELRHIEINTSSRARTLRKILGNHPSFGLLECLVGSPFKCHAMHKLGNLNVLGRCKTSSY